jgi:hypothetical protein
LKRHTRAAAVATPGADPTPGRAARRTPRVLCSRGARAAATQPHDPPARRDQPCRTMEATSIARWSASSRPTSAGRNCASATLMSHRPRGPYCRARRLERPSGTYGRRPRAPLPRDPRRVRRRCRGSCERRSTRRAATTSPSTRDGRARYAASADERLTPDDVAPMAD